MIIVRYFVFAILLSFVAVPLQAQEPEKKRITSSDVISKHLASLGTSADVADSNSRVLVGTSLMTSKGAGAVKLSGPAQLASVGDKFLLAMMFEVAVYPYEKVGFDGDDVSFGRHSGVESSLAFFLRANKGVLKRGLFGGSLNANWALLRTDATKYFEYDGISKEDHGSFHRLKFTSSGMGNLLVSVYLDEVSFRHVRTEYKFNASGLMSYSPTGIAAARSDGPEYYTLIESFGDFAKVGKVSLPLTYNIEFSHKSAMRSYNWITRFSEAYFNETLDPGVFKVS
jgi:hypothetical protein